MGGQFLSSSEMALTYNGPFGLEICFWEELFIEKEMLDREDQVSRRPTIAESLLDRSVAVSFFFNGKIRTYNYRPHHSTKERTSLAVPVAVCPQKFTSPRTHCPLILM